MSSRRVNEVSHRLSLREPQRESLAILDRVVAAVGLDRAADPAATLAAIRELFPDVTSFERDFPSLCFALATGVGKTRLMGAFIAYLHLARGLNDFFVLAPNLTIYEKLKADFTPGTRKYVFTGMGELLARGVEVITGDNYASGRGVRAEKRQPRSDFQPRFEYDRAAIHINIFNISKINGEVRGNRAPKMKKLQEYIGESYFDYLAGLDDLVLIMDESHRYRGSAGVKALNELRPVLGLELTATPRVEAGSKSVPFQNVIYNYSLATAMADGFVKEPAVATRENFRPADYDEANLERIKLGRRHPPPREHQGRAGTVRPPVRPAARQAVPAGRRAGHDPRQRDRRPDQAGRLLRGAISRQGDRRPLESDRRGVRQDDRGPPLGRVARQPDRDRRPRQQAQGGLGRDEPVHDRPPPRRQLEDAGRAVDRPRAPPPLRPADRRDGGRPPDDRGARQVPGDRRRGERPELDHRAQVVLGRDVPLERKQSGRSPRRSSRRSSAPPPPRRRGRAAPVKPLSNRGRPRVARLTYQAIQEVSRDAKLVPRAAALQTPAVQAAIERKVAAAMVPLQPEFAAMAEQPDIAAIRAQVTERLIVGTIDLPRIIVVPTSAVVIGFHDFDLDARTIHLQPVSQDILIQHLRTNDRERLTNAGDVIREARPEDYLVRGLIDHDDIDYEEQADFLYKLSGQVVARLRSYLPDEGAIHNVLQFHGPTLVRLIYQQMQEHRWERATGYEATVNRGTEVPVALAFDEIKGETIRPFREAVERKSDIPKLLFGGFRRCIYPVQKFSSDPERRFAVLLEAEPDDALKWFKPARNQFKIFYRSGEGYEPDFVVETATHKYLCEPKRADDVGDPVVLDKARAAASWCHHATEHELAHGGKPWSYLLIPHDAITASATLAGLAASYTCKPIEDDRADPILITR